MLKSTIFNGYKKFSWLGGGGVKQILTLADTGGEGDLPKPDIGWHGGGWGSKKGQNCLMSYMNSPLHWT